MSLALLPLKYRMPLLVGLATFLVLAALLTIIPIPDKWFDATVYGLLLITGSVVYVYVRARGIGSESTGTKGEDPRLKRLKKYKLRKYEP